MNCLDTYALIEISRGNTKFSWIMKDDFVITDLTLAEFYMVVRKEHNDQTAQYWYKKLAPFCSPVARQTIINALIFRDENRKSSLSVFDAVGYIFSKENNHKFVTGDKEFRNKPGVKFIQK